MALIVEDGTGLDDAQSYVSVADADAYWLLHGDPAAWSGSTTAQKEHALRLATQALDAEYRFRGMRAIKTQALAWPRTGGIDDDGFAIADDAVPVKLTHATAELAKRVRDGATLVPDTAAGAGVLAANRVKVGPIEQEQRFVGGALPAADYPLVRALLRHLIRNANELIRA